MAEIEKKGGEWHLLCQDILAVGEFNIKWKQLIFNLIIYIVKLYSWNRADMLGFRVVAVPSTDQIVWNSVINFLGNIQILAVTVRSAAQ